MWLCYVRKVNGCVEIKSYLEGKLIYQSDDLDDLFRNVPDYSTIIFENSDEPEEYKVNTAEFSSHHIAIYGNFNIIKFGTFSVPRYSYISSTQLEEGTIKHGECALLKDCNLKLCKIRGGYICDSVLRKCSVHTSKNTPTPKMKIINCNLDRCVIYDSLIYKSAIYY